MAGGNGLTQHQFDLIVREAHRRSAQRIGKPAGLRLSAARYLERFVDKLTVAGNRHDSRVALQGEHQALDVRRQPNVVLIGEEDYITRAMHYRVFEILVDAAAYGIGDQFHWKRRRRRERADHIQGLVRGSIVADAQFVRGPSLTEKRLELLREVAGALIGG